MHTQTLYDLAHARTGDKGNRINISVIARRAEDYPLLVAQVTEQRVAAHFAHRQPSRVTRYLLPNLAAMNFVIDDVLDGGTHEITASGRGAGDGVADTLVGGDGAQGLDQRQVAVQVLAAEARAEAQADTAA
jgi:hypothetical protein